MKTKKVVYAKGNVQMPIFYRSAMKPLQAIPVFRSGIIEKYSLRPVEAALFTASQRGESYHVAHLQNLSKKLQIDEEQLICHASYPLNEAPKQDYISKHLPKKKAFAQLCWQASWLSRLCEGEGI
ncbi:asparaginase [Virgibacillus halophilus]|uniref:Asparaginase n=1 Tax=Tigheibacillus halophilus TaxID=361280 RepID=A0ABU5C3G6_9BACI|nr:asparaginase [Virgibacillus halophilus]